MQEFAQGQLSIHCQQSGEGQPILLLHGFLEDHRMWDDLLPHLHNRGYETYAIDLPCHGLSRFDGTACQMEQMAEIVHDFCSLQNLDNPWIIGHSMGGYVGLEMLRKGNYRLCLLHSNFWPDSDQKKSDRNRLIKLVEKSKNLFIQEAIPHLFFAPNRGRCQKVIDRLVEQAKEIPAEEISASTAGLRDRKANHDLFEEHDIYIVHGTEDPVCTTEKLHEELGKLEKKPVVFNIPECGHMGIWEQPEKLIQGLKTFLVS